MKSKENAKITNKLIRNEDMTTEGAIKANKQLKKIHYRLHYLQEAMLENQGQVNNYCLE